jgi:hypothetical protein
MFTQEEKDIEERLNSLQKDDLNEIIPSLGIDSTSANNSSKRQNSPLKINRLTWEKFNTFLLLVYGSAILGDAFAGVRGATVGAAIAVLYSWYIFNNKENHSQSPDRSC